VSERAHTNEEGKELYLKKAARLEERQQKKKGVS